MQALRQRPFVSSKGRTLLVWMLQVTVRTFSCRLRGYLLFNDTRGVRLEKKLKCLVTVGNFIFVSTSCDEASTSKPAPRRAVFPPEHQVEQAHPSNGLLVFSSRQVSLRNIRIHLSCVWRHDSMQAASRLQLRTKFLSAASNAPKLTASVRATPS